MPEVSVLMGTYNEKSRMQAAQAIDSILNQTFRDFELLICDDGSELEFYHWLQEYCRKDARIRLLRNEKNCGLAAVLNRCLLYAAGIYAARMDADDIARPDRLEKQAAFLKQNREYAFVGSSAYLMDEHGIWGMRKMAQQPENKDFLYTSPFIHPSVMFRRKVLVRMHGYCQRPDVLRAEDYELFMRMYAAGFRGYNIQEPLLEYREDACAYRKRTYVCRLNECRVRLRGFLQLGILRGNLRYVIKPLIVGMLPHHLVRKIHIRKYGKGGQKILVSDFKAKDQKTRMDDIKIFAVHSPDSCNLRVKHPMLYHTAAGGDLWSRPIPKGMLSDNTGEHISEKNKAYCELTVQYWAWKNIEADYYGFCHYRRYFSFASKMLPQADCGFPVYPYMERDSVRRLCMDEQNMRWKIGQYDFLIAKAIPVRPWAKSVYENYKKAPQLHQKDLDLFLKIICKQYPKLKKAAKTYMNGGSFYPFNMFIMKKEIFYEYCKMLFTVLDEFERRAELKHYSREAYRTPGHLGERFAGIYYVYLQQLGGYRLGELQPVLFEQTKRSALQTAGRREIPIVLAADRAYVPILFTCLKSLCSHADAEKRYHIYIFHTSIAESDEQVFQKELACRHIRIDFVDVGSRVARYRLKAKGKITAETYYRFLILDILKDCPKVVYLDVDTIICEDIAKLYEVQMGDCLLAAVLDVDVIGQYNGANPDTRQYQDAKLKLNDPYGYVQAGVLVLQPALLLKETSVEQLFAMAQLGDYRYSDQDILNIVCQGRIKQLDMAWNVLMDSRHKRMEVIKYAPKEILEAYERARACPYIIHYCGAPKPWEDPGQDFAEKFWQTAGQTPFYETLAAQMAGQQKKDVWPKKAAAVLRIMAKKILPQGSGLRRMAGMIYWKFK